MAPTCMNLVLNYPLQREEFTISAIIERGSFDVRAYVSALF